MASLKTPNSPTTKNRYNPDASFEKPGDIRKYPIGNAFGVVLDIFHAWSLDEDDEEELKESQTDKDK